MRGDSLNLTVNQPVERLAVRAVSFTFCFPSWTLHACASDLSPSALLLVSQSVDCVSFFNTGWVEYVELFGAISVHCGYDHKRPQFKLSQENQSSSGTCEEVQ